ncbi:methyltransferase domain-containing protein [Humitalea sp. 24SJ18S-53]|uniref:class I SAM-dependent DNA methyltransferase n=1 Tax=Humitalea sp. 24SJ18S-53 TaxID=3422307 RepID=UPI003D6743B7
MAQPDPDALLKSGTQRHAAGDLPGAVAQYRAALQARPGDPNALNLLGVAARQQGDVALALRFADAAVRARPESAVFLANFGATLAEAGQLPAAVKFLQAALRRAPRDAVAWRNLGQALAAQGDAAGAVEPLTRAIALAPRAAEPRLALAHARREAGDAEGARQAATEALARAGRDAGMAAQARFLLAALGAGEAPDRAPAAYVRGLFDQYAGRFDADLEGNLGYRTPSLLAAALAAAGVTPARALRVLDLGCGTGLSGLVLAPFAARMEGVDLSPRMLALAEARGLYAALHAADLLAFLPPQAGGWDLVAAVDVLNYLGDLGPALQQIAVALVPGGIAAFSIETGDVAPFALGEGMRYRHAPAHVAALAAAAGFSVLIQQDAVLREEKGVPVAGTLFVLRR